MSSDSKYSWSKKLIGLPNFSIVQIADYIKENGKERAFDKGYNFFTEGYIHDAFACKTKTQFFVKSKCWRSQRKNEKPHELSVKIELSASKISGGNCSCVAGSGGACNHIIALLYMINHWKNTKQNEIPADLSSTSVAQKWHVPRGEKIEPEPVMKLSFAKATTDRKTRKREPVSCYLYDARAKKQRTALSKDQVIYTTGIIANRNSSVPIVYLSTDHSYTNTETIFGDVPIGSPLSYQLKDYHSSVLEFTAFLPSVVHIALEENICFPDLPIPNPSLKMTFPSELFNISTIEFLKSLETPGKKSIEIEQLTIEQGKSQLWHDCRKYRLTASQFGDIMNRKSQPSQTFLRNLFSTKDLSTVTAISHGRDKEDLARKAYIKKMKKRAKHEITVYQTGLMINPFCGYLGASPDGKVIDKSTYDHYGLLEIKCPHKYRNYTIGDASENNDFCLEYRNGQLHLKRTHNYYYQITGQMAISGVNWCDFVVFTNKGIFVERIYFDKTVWSEMFKKLTEFYINSAVPFLKDSST